ncbi:MAG: tRNA lysidine(34) synthetase TilS [Spirochaetales bacterium]|nr:tRNA lysidine(34) synthetase TilS [Spirochaetales bacterium]
MSLTENRLNKEILNFFSSLPRKDNAKVLIGFSGGADSLSLAILLWENRKKLKIEPVLAYLDHGIRAAEELETEGIFARSFAEKLGIKLFRGEIAAGVLKERARSEGRSLEEVARLSRYDFFKGLMDKKGFDLLALGHHQDDQMETLIMRFFQGGSAAGLSGIKAVRGNIIRPLLAVEKRTLIKFLEERGDVWITDPSNLDEDFLRNRIRNNLMPAIEAVFPGYRRSLSSLSDKMASTAAFIEAEQKSRVQWRAVKGVDQNTTWSLDSEVFFNTPRTLVIESLFNLYNLTFPERKRVPFRFLNSLSSSAEGGILEKSDGVLLAGYGISLKILKGRVFWSRDIVFPQKNSYLIIIRNNRSFIVSEYKFKIELIERRYATDNGIYIRKGEINPPVFIRSRLPGDEIYLPEGNKSLKKLFNGWHLDAGDKWKVPVIVDKSGILGVLASPWGGLNRFSERNEVKNKTVNDECWFISWSLREF